jgi:nicotinate-nucleotide adenylyltransferase
LNSELKIGLFGGSFDPVHSGHLLVAQAACEELNLSRLYFIPAAQSPFKPANVPAPASERLRLLRLATAGHTRYGIDEQEIHRGGVSFTIDTVRYYVSRFPEAQHFYLIGADHVPQLPKWRAVEELARLVEFVVIPRPGQTSCAAPPGIRLHTLTGFPLGVSSSQIRARVRAGLPIQGLVPSSVAEAIHNNRLYL